MPLALYNRNSSIKSLKVKNNLLATPIFIPNRKMGGLVSKGGVVGSASRQSGARSVQRVTRNQATEAKSKAGKATLEGESMPIVSPSSKTNSSEFDAVDALTKFGAVYGGLTALQSVIKKGGEMIEKGVKHVEKGIKHASDDPGDDGIYREG